MTEQPTRPATAAQLVQEQAEDEGLWFQARTAPEGYLQQELRKLHAAVEAEAAARDPEAVRLRAALVEILAEPDHDAQCRTIGPEAEADCIMAGLKERAALAASPEPAEGLDVLLALSDKIGARYLDHDWNAPNLILRSDGSGKLVAKAFEPYVADFIVAAARYLARLQQQPKEQG